MDRSIKKIAIFGAGGFGLEVAMLIDQINDRQPSWKTIGFFDDGLKKGTEVNGLEVLGGIKELNEVDFELNVVFAIGSPKTKQVVIKKIDNDNICYPVLVHPAAILGSNEYLSIGEGSIICAGCLVTTNIRIGRHVILNLACTVGHEANIDDYSAFMPTCNISGEVQIGGGNFWGTGAKIINRCTVGENVVIGAGAVVIADIPDNVTAVGVPAKVMKKNGE
jgi:sugar O-acyltransferase (sialic acid O-acetyltransferase NeuD family)